MVLLIVAGGVLLAIDTTRIRIARRKSDMALIQAGIRKINFGSGTTSMPQAEFEAAATMFREAGVHCEALA